MTFNGRDEPGGGTFRGLSPATPFAGVTLKMSQNPEEGQWFHILPSDFVWLVLTGLGWVRTVRARYVKKNSLPKTLETAVRHSKGSKNAEPTAFGKTLGSMFKIHAYRKGPLVRTVGGMIMQISDRPARPASLPPAWVCVCVCALCRRLVQKKPK